MANTNSLLSRIYAYCIRVLSACCNALFNWIFGGTHARLMAMTEQPCLTVRFEFAGLESADEQITNNAKGKCSCSMAKVNRHQVQLPATGLLAVPVPIPDPVAVPVPVPVVLCSRHNVAAINAKCKPLALTKTSAPPAGAGNSNPNTAFAQGSPFQSQSDSQSQQPASPVVNLWCSPVNLQLSGQLSVRSLKCVVVFLAITRHWHTHKSESNWIPIETRLQLLRQLRPGVAGFKLDWINSLNSFSNQITYPLKVSGIKTRRCNCEKYIHYHPTWV